MNELTSSHSNEINAQPSFNNERTEKSESSTSGSDEDINNFELKIPSSTSYSTLISDAINQDSLFTFSKETHKTISKEERNNCKIMKFNSEWEFEDVQIEISRFDPKVYQNLFIIIVEIQNCRLFKTIKQEERILKRDKRSFLKCVLKFCENRPMILQLRSKIENFSMIYFKDESSLNFECFELEICDENKIENFPSFCCSFINQKTDKFKDFEDLILNNLLKSKHSSLILRFLKILKPFGKGEELFTKIAKKVATEGSISDLKAVLGSTFDSESIYFDIKSQKYLIDVLDCENWFCKDVEKDNEPDEETELMSEEENHGDETRPIFEKHSLLSIAVVHSNEEVVKFLVNKCHHFVRQLYPDHQWYISTEAYKMNKLDLLCDLLEFCDFPFPSDFSADEFPHTRLNKIINERAELHSAVALGNFEKIDDFIKNNENIQFAFSAQNCTALNKALESHKFDILHYLISHGFKAIEFDDYMEKLSNKKDINLANKQAIIQRKQNIDNAHPDEEKTVNLLASKSCVHNKRIGTKIDLRYHRKIRKWFKEIYEIEENRPELDNAAECDDLKFVFDFQSDSVENVTINGQNSLGIMYPKSKWIVIGAKLFDKEGNREERIKGVIAHEIGHYAMKLRYENNENPYYFHDNETKKKFEEIVNEINEWKDIEINNPDDECDGIISSVFTSYNPADYHVELIVRVPQILTQYSKDMNKIEYLSSKYKALFDFHREHVLHDLKKFSIKKRESVRKFNKSLGLLTNIMDLKYELTSLKAVKNIFSGNVTIITTNIPKLLLLNVYKVLSKKFGSLADAENNFIDCNDINNSLILTDLKDIVENNPNLHLYMDCSRGTIDNLGAILDIKPSNVTFVVKISKICHEIENILKQKDVEIVQELINYKWSDLTALCKHELLKTKVNFQKRAKKFKICDIFSSIDTSKSIVEDGKGINDPELLSLIVEGTEISINEKYEVFDKNFHILFQTRNFVKKECIRNFEEQFEEKDSYKFTTISQEILLKEVKGKKIVLLSDIAGTGKTWTLNNISEVLRDLYPTNWITVVDLKEYLKKYEQAFGAVVDFAAFITKNILKLKLKSFELEIFRKLYKIGKVCILFDGFDEIAPDCAEFVINLMKSFEHNGGNQLWVATRDYFELDLEMRLNIDVVYKIEPFSQSDGINLMISTWIMKDFCDSVLDSRVDFENLLKSSDNYITYKNQALELNRKILGLNNKFIGFPLFYNMIAKVFLKNKNITTDLTPFRIFSDYIEMQLEVWSHEKGAISKKMSISLQVLYAMTFKELHYFFAMSGFYRDFLCFCDIKLDRSNWTDEKIIACGLLTKKGEKFFFPHETFREYFAADFIISILMKGDRFIDEEFCKYLIDFLTIREYGVVRMFLDNAFGEKLVRKAVDQKLPKIAKLFYQSVDQMDDLWRILDENRVNLEDFLIRLFQFGNYKDVKKIFIKYVGIYRKPSFKFMKCLLNFFTKDDIKDLLTQKVKYGGIFIHELVQHARSDVIIYTFTSLKNKLSSNQYQEIIKSKGYLGRNLLQSAADRSEDIEAHKFLWHLCQGYCKSNSEFLLFLKDADKQRDNVFHLAVKYSTNEIFEFMMEELQKMTSDEEIKKLLIYLGYKHRNLLQSVAERNKSLEIHENVWKFVTKYFNSVEILNMIMHFDESGSNLLHIAVRWNTLEIVKLTWNKIKKFINTQNNQTEYLRKRGKNGLNLISLSKKNVLDRLEVPAWIENLILEYKVEFPKSPLLPIVPAIKHKIKSKK